jgi:hypothetical protein
MSNRFFTRSVVVAAWLAALLATPRRADAQTFTVTLTYPPNGAVNADLSQPLQWSFVPGSTILVNADAYYLYIGTTIGAHDLVNTGEIQQTSYLAPSLPVGPTLYVRLFAKAGGVWHYADSTFTAGVPTAVLTASITYPANGAVHADLSQPLQWTSVAGAQAYYLYVGTATGASDIVNSGEMQQTSYVLRTFPANQVLYARLFTKFGALWRYTSITFSGDVLTAQITSPVNATTTADWAQPIQWTSVPNAQAYYLYVGTSPGANNLINSGEIHQTSFSASGLPANQVVYARLYTEVGGVWRYTDSSFRGDILTTRITSPADSSLNADWMQPIRWTVVPNAQAYYLYVGTSLGTHDLINTGEIHQLSYPATNLPANQVVYARMFAEVGGVWRYTDSTFSGDILTARITSPASGSIGANFGQPMQWTTVPNAQAYYLYVGTSVGANNLINTGEIHQTSYPIDGLPANQTVYARIYAKVGGIWRFTDSSFSGATITATITYPANGAVNADMSIPIQWTPIQWPLAPIAQAYYLYVGTTPGAKDLVDSGETLNVFYPAGAVPTGQTLFARIWTKTGGIWRYTDSSFSAAARTSQDVTITFGRLGPAPDPFATYTESGFTVSPTQSSWVVQPSNGFPAPFIGFGFDFSTNVIGQVQVVATGHATFRFKSVDLWSLSSPFPYTITGFRNSAPVFTLTGAVSRTFGNFRTLVNPHSNDVIDTLSISLANPPECPTCINPVGLDNISLSR